MPGVVIFNFVSSWVFLFSRPPSSNRIEPAPPLSFISGWIRLFAKASPVMSVVSFIVPPVCLIIFTLVGSALPFLRIIFPASNANFERWDSIAWSNLPASDVSIADRICSSVASMASSSKALSAKSSAKAKPLAIVAGCTPWRTSCQAFRSISAQITTVDVVPSRATLSCVEEVLITIFATGCSTRAVSRTVTPSLVTNVLPSSSTNNLSRPFGPSVDLTAPASAIAACTFLRNASRPLVLSVDSRIVSSAIDLANSQPTLKPVEVVKAFSSYMGYCSDYTTDG